jgi:hypothetical protein
MMMLGRQVMMKAAFDSIASRTSEAKQEVVEKKSHSPFQDK